MKWTAAEVERQIENYRFSSDNVHWVSLMRSWLELEAQLAASQSECERLKKRLEHCWHCRWEQLTIEDRRDAIRIQRENEEYYREEA